MTEKGRERRVIAESVEQIGRTEKRRANKAESGGGDWETRAEKCKESRAERARGAEWQRKAERSRPGGESCRDGHLAIEALVGRLLLLEKGTHQDTQWS